MTIAHDMPHLVDKLERMETKVARISDTLFIPFHTIYQTEAFIEDFIESLTQAEIKNLTQQWDEFEDFFINPDNLKVGDFAQEFANDLCLHCPFTYLVKIETSQSISHVEVIDNEPRNFSFTWGSYSSEWCFANDMEHAVDQAIQLGHENLLAHAKKTGSSTE